MLLAEIDGNYREAYDFFYLPIDFKNRCNVGYAFINFMDFRRIVPFTREFHGQRWRNFNSEKVGRLRAAVFASVHWVAGSATIPCHALLSHTLQVCAISYARIQGKASMISRFQNSSLMEKEGEYRPLLFVSSGPDKGKPEPFPISTRKREAAAAAAAAAVGGGQGMGISRLDKERL